MNQFQIKQKILVIRMPRELDHHSAELIRMEAGGAEEYSAGRI